MEDAVQPEMVQFTSTPHDHAGDPGTGGNMKPLQVRGGGRKGEQGDPQLLLAIPAVIALSGCCSQEDQEGLGWPMQGWKCMGEG